MGFIKLASTSDAKPNSMMGLKINDKKILLANINGNYFALSDVCAHRGCTLSKGKLQGETVVCPCHGSTYDLKTGNFLKGPTKLPEAKYELKVENNDILINL
ncbi:MAG: Rieske (2Fe-2S) protein [Candidatus Bathyarchaeia archaeon]|jgi:nitrite reductase/ring-hydroxylating ferredoxin subunit